MTVIYIRLMLESLDSDCILYYEGYFENLKEELALKLDVSEDEIDMTMAYFTKCGLIQIDEDKNAELPQAKALIQQETDQAAYMRAYREKKRLEKEKSYNVRKITNNVENCKTEIEKEKEIDIESEVEDRKENSAAAEKSDFNIYQYYQERIGVLDGFQMEQLRGFIEIDKMEIALVKRAIDKAADNSKRNFGYIKKILLNWVQNGILTVIQQDEEQRQYTENRNGQAFQELGRDDELGF